MMEKIQYHSIILEILIESNYKFILQYFFERKHHFILLFQSFHFNGKTNSLWADFDSLNAITVWYDEFHLNPIKLIEENKVLQSLGYQKIKDNSVNLTIEFFYNINYKCFYP